MIISAGRRTDIPAFYGEWFARRLRAGFCTVPNPVNARQVSVVSLRPEDVEAFVFWTRLPRPFLPVLDVLDGLGTPYHFLYTLLDNPRALEPKRPSLRASLRTFRDLSDRLGPGRVVWRYDPVVLSNATDAAFHLDAFAKLAASLKDHTRTCVFSFMEPYRKIQKRLDEAAAQGVRVISPSAEEKQRLVSGMLEIAADNGLELRSCAQGEDIKAMGVAPGKCIDDALLAREFGLRVSPAKDPGQRGRCRCVKSRDISMYDSCVFGCRYCYATTSFALAARNRAAHNPDSPSLLGWFEPTPQDASDGRTSLLDLK